MLASLITTISDKKAELDRLRPLVPSALIQLERATDLELTYTSDAIEGNTLTQIENQPRHSSTASRSAARNSRII